MSVRIYVEGGGLGREQQGPLREAFATLLEKARPGRPRPGVTCSGSCDATFRDFCKSLKERGSDALLLADSDHPVQQDAWKCVGSRPRNRWQRPRGTQDDQLHLMVELMESWFLADRNLLASYFGEGFIERHLPGTANTVEGLPKSDVEDGLKNATKASRRGPYDKGKHSADLLSRLDPEKLRKAAPHFQRLLDAITARLG